MCPSPTLFRVKEVLLESEIPFMMNLLNSEYREKSIQIKILTSMFLCYLNHVSYYVPVNFRLSRLLTIYIYTVWNFNHFRYLMHKRHLQRLRRERACDGPSRPYGVSQCWYGQVQTQDGLCIGDSIPKLLLIRVTHYSDVANY